LILNFLIDFFREGIYQNFSIMIILLMIFVFNLIKISPRRLICLFFLSKLRKLIVILTKQKSIEKSEKILQLIFISSEYIFGLFACYFELINSNLILCSLSITGIILTDIVHFIAEIFFQFKLKAVSVLNNNKVHFVHYHIRIGIIMRILIFFQILSLFSYREIDENERMSPIMPFYIYLVLITPLLLIFLLLNLFSRCFSKRKASSDPEFKEILSKIF